MFLNNEELQIEYNYFSKSIRNKCEYCTKDSENFDDLDKCKCSQNIDLYLRLLKGGIPKKYLNEDITWDNAVKQIFVSKCRKYAENFEQHYSNGEGMFLFGSQGLGKSTMEVLIAKEVANKINPYTKKKYNIIFIPFKNVMDLAYDKIKNQESFEKFNDITLKSDLLIIDNLGSEAGANSETGFNKITLDGIIRDRVDRCKPIIISSNFNLEKIEENYSTTIHDLIIENFIINEVIGEIVRLNKGRI